MFAATLSFGRGGEWCEQCHRAHTAMLIRKENVRCDHCHTVHYSFARQHERSFAEQMLDAAAQCEVEFNRLADCLPGIIGSSPWPDPESGSVDEDKLMRCVRTMRTFDLAYELDEQAAAALAFVYLFFGPSRRETTKREIGEKWHSRALAAWIDARAFEAIGRTAKVRVCLVRLCDGLSRIAYGNADVAGRGERVERRDGEWSETRAEWGTEVAPDPTPADTSRKSVVPRVRVMTFERAHGERALLPFESERHARELEAVAAALARRTKAPRITLLPLGRKQPLGVAGRLQRAIGEPQFWGGVPSPHVAGSGNYRIMPAPVDADGGGKNRNVRHALP